MERMGAQWVTPSVCRLFVVSCYLCSIGSFYYDLRRNDFTAIAIRWLVLRAIFGTYMLAFASLAWQAKGLVGSSGILPMESSVRYWKMRTYDGSPLLLRLRMRFQIWLWDGRSDRFLIAMTCTPILIALAGLCLIDGTVRCEQVLFKYSYIPPSAARLLEPLCMCTLYATYASLRLLAGEFTQLQWDSLLLEVSLYCTVLAAMPANHPVAMLCLVHALRFIMFKLWISSGVVKIMSGDQSWKSLRAMHYHYLTQPLPNRLAWYFHGLPNMVHYSEVLFTFVGELVVPYFVFFGAWARQVCFLTHCTLLVGIAVTGNYGFFQILCMSADIAYLDDAQLPHWVRDLAEFGHDNPVQSLLAEYCAPATLCLVWLLNGEPLVNLSRMRIQPYGIISRINSTLGALHACGSYGLFAVMTTRRLEVVLEGSRDGETWHELEMPWKPGNIKRAPPMLPPGHMPRLDWRLWFIPLRRGSPPQWFLSLLERILDGSPHVYGLFQNWGPFTPKQPPFFVRARLFEYGVLKRSDLCPPHVDTQMLKRYGFAKPRWFAGGAYARIPEAPADWWVRREVGMYYEMVGDAAER